MNNSVRIDFIRHIVPKADSGKKEWYIIGISSEFVETENFIGCERLPDVFLSPDQFNSLKNVVAVGAVCEVITETSIYNGRYNTRVVGFK